MDGLKFIIILYSVILCTADLTLRQLLERAVAKQNRRSNAHSRRAEFHFDPNEASGVLGAPRYPSHLPEAEPILPGHTLLRPALGMLKSAVKFPHRDLENGAGVLGNINNLGIRYDGKNERVLYTEFRRMPKDYLMVAPSRNKKQKPTFDLSSLVLDMDKEEASRNKVLKLLKERRKPAKSQFDLSSVYLDLDREENSRSKVLKKRRKQKEPEIIIFVVNPQENQYETFGNYKNRNNEKLKGEPQKRFLRYSPNPNIRSKNSSKILRQRVKGTVVSLDRGRNHAEDDDEYDDKPSNMDEGVVVTLNTSEEETDTKSNWMIKSKNMFTHIKINQDAPELVDLLPTAEQVEKTNSREWWFFNQVDFKPFTGEQ